MSPEAGSYIVRFRLADDGAERRLVRLKTALDGHRAVALVTARAIDVFSLGVQPDGHQWGAVDCRGFASFSEALRVVREAAEAVGSPGGPDILGGDLDARLI